MCSYCVMPGTAAAQVCAVCREGARRAGGRVRESLRCLCAHAGRSAVLEGCVLVWSCCELELWQCAWMNCRSACSRAGELATRAGCPVGVCTLRMRSRLQPLHDARAGSAAQNGMLHAIANARPRRSFFSRDAPVNASINGAPARSYGSPTSRVNPSAPSQRLGPRLIVFERTLAIHWNCPFRAERRVARL